MSYIKKNHKCKFNNIDKRRPLCHFCNKITVDGIVKSLQLRHSRVGGSPEEVEMTELKSSLISRLRGNDEKLVKCGFSAGV